MEVDIRSIQSLTESEMNLMNFWIEKEFGKKYVRDFKKDYSLSNSRCFFVKEQDEIVAFEIISPVVAELLGKKYEFFGMGDLVTIRRGEGYGRIIIEATMKYLKDLKKTGLGFCARKNTPIYKKVGLDSIENFMKRFRYKDPDTGDISSEVNGDGVFCDFGGLVKNILSSDELVYLDNKLW